MTVSGTTANGEHQPWRSTFDFFDLNRSGTISVDELQKCLAAFGQIASEDHVRALIKEVDLDESGEIDYSEFVKLMSADGAAKIDKATLERYFQSLDKDGSGYVTTAELRHAYTALGHGLTDEQMDLILDRYDADGSGQLTFDEFVEVVRDGHGIEVDDTDEVCNSADSPVACMKDGSPASSPMSTKAEKEDDEVLDIMAMAEILKPLADADGKVRKVNLQSAVDLWVKHRSVKSSDPEADPALHWTKGRAKPGLGEVLYKANHIAIIVSDVGRSADFYANVIGLQQIRRPDFDRHGAWFTMGNLELHLIKGVPVVHSGKDLIVGHISLETFDIDKVPGILQRCNVAFRQNVSVPKGKMQSGQGTEASSTSSKIVKQYFLRDPDGYYIEVCNCDVLTQYCLGKYEDLAGYDQGVALSLKEATLFVNLGEKLAHNAVKMQRELEDLYDEMQGKSAAEIAAKLGCTTRAEKVDDEKLKRLLVRLTVYGDICQNETEESIGELLQMTNNHVPTAIKIMQIRGRGCRVMQPPAFFEQGSEKVKPEAFTVSFPAR